jgi:hypothetical protein
LAWLGAVLGERLCIYALRAGYLITFALIVAGVLTLGAKLFLTLERTGWLP